MERHGNSSTEETKQAIVDAQRWHDIKGALSGFSAVLKLLKAGYRFDDNDREVYISELERCLQTLERELSTMQNQKTQTQGGDLSTIP